MKLGWGWNGQGNNYDSQGISRITVSSASRVWAGAMSAKSFYAIHEHTVGFLGDLKTGFSAELLKISTGGRISLSQHGLRWLPCLWANLSSRTDVIGSTSEVTTCSKVSANRTAVASRSMPCLFPNSTSDNRSKWFISSLLIDVS